MKFMPRDRIQESLLCFYAGVFVIKHCHRGKPKSLISEVNGDRHGGTGSVFYLLRKDQLCRTKNETT